MDLLLSEIKNANGKIIVNKYPLQSMNTTLLSWLLLLPIPNEVISDRGSPLIVFSSFLMFTKVPLISFPLTPAKTTSLHTCLSSSEDLDEFLPQ